MNQYIYLILGIVLGISLAVYYFLNREEKIEKQIEHKENIIKTDVDVKEFEKYIELSLTYEVLENIGTYEKIEY